MLQRSSDGVQFEIPLAAAKMSELIRDTLSSGEDDTDITVPDDAIDLSNIKSSVLGKVFEFCKHHESAPDNEKMMEISVPFKSEKIEELVPAWYHEFIKVDTDSIQDLVSTP